jgi:hypothetical protein
MDKTVSVFKLNPLQDPRWQDFVDHHQHGSVFHSTPWLDALSRTYGYEPVVYTTTPPANKLLNGIVFAAFAVGSVAVASSPFHFPTIASLSPAHRR